MPINKFFSYLYGRYRTFILIGTVIAVVSAFSSYRQISSRGKEQRKKRETIRSLSQEELDFECQKIIQRTNSNEEFNQEELDSVIRSFKNLAVYAEKDLNYAALRQLVSTYAHMTFKTNFAKTEEAARSLTNILGDPSISGFRRIFERVLMDGHWEKAAAFAHTKFGVGKSKQQSKPWAVLVAGLGGIRKTTSVNSSWFQKLLFDAMKSQLDPSVTEDDMPCGDNSFFRQLDFIVATVANAEFKKLYDIDEVANYAKLKSAIFSRYRTLAEICGMQLINEAKKKKMNVLIETSGRDISMFEYVNHCFPSSEYNKLLIYFTINDISFAEKSVDNRMQFEMKSGKTALDSEDDVVALIRANAGGPYGAAQLKTVQAESDDVVNSVLNGNSQDIAKDWFRAILSVEAHEDEPWKIRPAKDGTQEFSFASSIVFKAGRADIRREVTF